MGRAREFFGTLGESEAGEDQRDQDWREDKRILEIIALIRGCLATQHDIAELGVLNKRRAGRS